MLRATRASSSFRGRRARTAGACPCPCTRSPRALPRLLPPTIVRHGDAASPRRPPRHDLPAPHTHDTPPHPLPQTIYHPPFTQPQNLAIAQQPPHHNAPLHQLQAAATRLLALTTLSTTKH